MFFIMHEHLGTQPFQKSRPASGPERAARRVKPGHIAGRYKATELAVPGESVFQSRWQSWGESRAARSLLCAGRGSGRRVGAEASHGVGLACSCAGKGRSVALLLRSSCCFHSTKGESRCLAYSAVYFASRTFHDPVRFDNFVNI